MKVKVFEGENLQLIIEQIKSEFGEGYTIIYQDIIEKRSFLPFFKKKKYVLLVEKREEDLQEENQEQIQDISYTKSYVDFNQFEEILNQSEKDLERNSKQEKDLTYTPKVNIPKKSEITDDNILQEFTGKSLDLIKMLIDKDVDIEVAVEVVKHACGFEMDSNKLDLKHYTFRESLLEGIEKSVNFAGDIFNDDERKRKVFVFLGPTGVGKTTNLFKIASKLVLERNKKVGVISTDTFKAGAGEQIRGYTNILKIPYGILSDPKKIRETLDDWSDMDVILIDTVGRSHYDHWKIGEMREILKYADEVDYILTLSCNMNKKEMYKIAEKFGKFFDIKYLFLTKIDETSFPGALLNLPVKTKLSLTYISTGQNVPEDIKILNPDRVVSYLLMER